MIRASTLLIVESACVLYVSLINSAGQAFQLFAEIIQWIYWNERSRKPEAGI